MDSVKIQFRRGIIFHFSPRRVWRAAQVDEGKMILPGLILVFTRNANGAMDWGISFSWRRWTVGTFMCAYPWLQEYPLRMFSSSDTSNRKLCSKIIQTSPFFTSWFLPGARIIGSLHFISCCALDECRLFEASFCAGLHANIMILQHTCFWVNPFYLKSHF